MESAMQRKVFWEDVISCVDGRYLWKYSIGKTVRFVYDGISGVMTIKKVLTDNEDRTLFVEYNDDIYSLTIQNFQRSMIGRIVAKESCEFNEGQILKDENRHIKLVNYRRSDSPSYNAKGFDYICMECGSSGYKTVAAIKSKTGCKSKKCREAYKNNLVT